MASYIPGAGLKQPMNLIEGPYYPEIQKGPPRFAWSRKHWTVDDGYINLNLEHNRQQIEPSILVQSRDYNKTIYGQSSHRDVVNKNFRPPLLTLEDRVPLSRIPRRPVRPRGNPSTVSDGGGTTTYTHQNGSLSNLQKHLTNRIKSSQISPVYYLPSNKEHFQNSFQHPHVLQRKIPAISIDSGKETFVHLDQEQKLPVLKKKMQSKPIYINPSTDISNISFDTIRNNPIPQNTFKKNINVVKYTITPETNFKQINEQSFKPFFRVKNKISGTLNSGISKTKFGIDSLRVQIK